MNHYRLVSTVLRVRLVYIYKLHLNRSEQFPLILREQLIHADRIQNQRFNSGGLAHLTSSGVNIHYVKQTCSLKPPQVDNYLFFSHYIVVCISTTCNKPPPRPYRLIRA